MWILIWKIWLSPYDVITEWEGTYPKTSKQECIAFGNQKAKAFNRVTFECKFYTKKEYDAIVKRIRGRQKKAPLI